ncbi:MAG: hypothetical protein AAFU53_08635 [Cyanobacteria bacterium J06632_3]
MARAAELGERDRYRLTEVLDPELTHFEFFLSRPPFNKTDWADDEQLLSAIAQRHPCIEGWPSRSFFNYEYQVVSITEDEYSFMENCSESDTESGSDVDKSQSPRTVAEVIDAMTGEADRAERLGLVRSLQSRQLIMLAIP